MLTRKFARLAVLLWLLGFCRLASAHPMGNFSVNHYSKINLQGDRIMVRYFIDLAEIPTFQELQQGNIATAPIDPNSPAIIRYVAARGAELGHGLTLEIDGNRIPLRLISSAVIFPPGAGGLPTMKMGFVYEALYPSAADRQNLSFHYADNNYPGHSGWKEIVALASAGSLLHSSVPAADRSGELSNYPTDLLTSPPQDLEASIAAVLPLLPMGVGDAKSPVSSEPLSRRVEYPAAGRPLPRNHSAAAVRGGPSPIQTATRKTATVTRKTATIAGQTATVPVAAAPELSQPASAASTAVDLRANRQLTPRSRFTELILAQHLSAWFLFTAAFIAIGLGGLHALEPGHGKTIVAAYLVGSRGTARHAVLLGLIVTASHTAGVFALGAITLYASRYIVPEQLYPWLSAFSGITIAALGCYMLLRRLTGTAADHSHTADTGHWHGIFSKRKTDEDAAANQVRIEEAPTKPVSLAQLLTLGITGGIIPCPAALIVLLSAFALHRIGLGFFLIVAFSVG